MKTAGQAVLAFTVTLVVGLYVAEFAFYHFALWLCAQGAVK